MLAGDTAGGDAMGRIVAKFGGSNMKERGDIDRIVRIVKAYGRPVTVVVSALYGITNKLIDTLHESLEDEAIIRRFSRMLYDLKAEILDRTVDSEEFRREVLAELETRLHRLERYLHGIHYLGEIPPSVEDTVVSYGERLSSLLLSSVLRFHGVDSREALPEDIGLVTDGEFGNATIDFARAAQAVRTALSPEVTWVVPGFYGVSPAGKVTVFGRGGSDYSAAGIARCLGAESVDVWKDVDGFRTADPKLVSSTSRIDELSYREAAELSYFGARILHPRTVEPLEDRGIPVRILDVERFDGSIRPASVICAHPAADVRAIRSVTYSDDIAILRLRGPGVGAKPGIVAGVTTALDNHGINIKSIITSQTSINLLLGRGELERSHELVKGLDFGVVTELLPVSDVSLIAVVGEGLAERQDLLSAVSAGLARASVKVILSATGASEVAAYYLVPERERTRAVQAIHAEVFPAL
jgi:bifunctional aspartokinase / homoserine dehydrogenase 1